MGIRGGPAGPAAHGHRGGRGDVGGAHHHPDRAVPTTVTALTTTGRRQPRPRPSTLLEKLPKPRGGPPTTRPRSPASTRETPRRRTSRPPTPPASPVRRLRSRPRPEPTARRSTVILRPPNTPDEATANTTGRPRARTTASTTVRAQRHEARHGPEHELGRHDAEARRPPRHHSSQLVRHDGGDSVRDNRPAHRRGAAPRRLRAGSRRATTPAPAAPAHVRPLPQPFDRPTHQASHRTRHRPGSPSGRRHEPSASRSPAPSTKVLPPLADRNNLSLQSPGALAMLAGLAVVVLAVMSYVAWTGRRRHG